jgi:hypothetical protein
MTGERAKPQCACMLSWLSRPGARCRDCSRPVSRPRSEAAVPGSFQQALHGGRRLAWLSSGPGLGILLPRWRYRVTGTFAVLDNSIPAAGGLCSATPAVRAREVPAGRRFASSGAAASTRPRA